MSPRRDLRAPSRLQALRDHLVAWTAEHGPAPSLAGLLERPAPEDPDDAAVAEADLVAALLADAPGAVVPRVHLAAAVRTGLSRLREANPGRLVEVRVPPFGAVQVGVPRVSTAHTRGTPPNVVETDAATWLGLASGRLSWPDAVAARRVSASGAHSDLSGQLAAALANRPERSRAAQGVSDERSSEAG